MKRQKEDGNRILVASAQRKEIDMEFTELIKRRRSVRGYEDVAVSHEDLEEILQKRSGISLEKALQLYFRWIAECPDEFEKWIKEIKLI